MATKPKTVILAGGLGTRLAEETAIIPKPMVEIGGKPILWHIMSIYAKAGFQDFVVALGYKGEHIKNYFLNFYALNSDLTVKLQNGRVAIHNTENARQNWTVHLVDTGPGTQTGGRLLRVREWLGNRTFMVTYGDGLADIDIQEVLRFHRRHGKLATVTAVHPPSRFGELRTEKQTVVAFNEKPQTEQGWINGGFFVLEPEALDFIDGEQTVWEREPLERIAKEGQLMAWYHKGFWQPMDTIREKKLLEALWDSGKAPWKIWQ